MINQFFTRFIRPDHRSPITDHLLGIAVIALVALLTGDLHACPTCKDAVAENDPQRVSMAAGYYYSILLMMSMPFIILTTFGSFAYRSVKRAQAERDARETSLPSQNSR